MYMYTHTHNYIHFDILLLLYTRHEATSGLAVCLALLDETRQATAHKDEQWEKRLYS